MDYISGWCKSKKRLDGVTAIVTGSNMGIGKETALDFYLRGARVIMACRDTKKADAAKSDLEKTPQDNKGTLIVEHLDVSSLKSVREFANLMLAREPKIQILVNNAGVMMFPEGRTEDGFETHMGTNHYGHALLTFMLLPKLKENGARIVCVSSVAHKFFRIDFDDFNFQKTPYDPKKAYAWSKGANILFARVLAKKLKESNIHNVTTYSLHPGVVRTGIARHFGDTFVRGATWLYDHFISWFVKSARCGAQTTIYCAVDDACAKESGLYYSDCAVTTPSKHCRRDDLTQKLWEFTIEGLGINDPFGNGTGSQNLLNDNKEHIIIDTKQLNDNKENNIIDTKQLNDNKENIIIDTKQLNDNKENIIIDTKQLNDNKENIIIDTKQLNDNKENIIIDTKQLNDNKENIIIDTKQLNDNKESIMVDAKQLNDNKEHFIIDTKQLNVNKESIMVDAKQLNDNKEHIIIDAKQLHDNKEHISSIDTTKTNDVTTTVDIGK